MPIDPADIDRIVARLDRARRVLFVTGAGVSVASGLPTYRGITGLYENADTPDGMPIEVALSGAMLKRAPALCWKYIAQIEAACRGASPNLAHTLVAKLASRVPEGTVLTQNVDALHQRAGATDVIAIHGDFRDLSCTRCTWQDRVEDYAGLDLPPACPRCDGLVRPGVVLFGEALPMLAVQRLGRALQPFPDIVFSIGTTSVFPYIAAPVEQARWHDALAVEINPGDTEVSHSVDVRLRTDAVAALSAVWTTWTGQPP